MGRKLGLVGRILAIPILALGLAGVGGCDYYRERGILELEKSEKIGSGSYSVEIYRNRATKERSIRVYIQEEQVSEGVDKDCDGKIDKLVFNRNDWKNPEQVVQGLYEQVWKHPK